MITKKEKMLFDKSVKEKQQVKAQYIEDCARHKAKHELRHKIRIKSKRREK